MKDKNNYSEKNIKEIPDDLRQKTGGDYKSPLLNDLGSFPLDLKPAPEMNHNQSQDIKHNEDKIPEENSSLIDELDEIFKNSYSMHKFESSYILPVNSTVNSILFVLYSTIYSLSIILFFDDENFSGLFSFVIIASLMLFFNKCLDSYTVIDTEAKEIRRKYCLSFLGNFDYYEPTSIEIEFHKAYFSDIVSLGIDCRFYCNPLGTLWLAAEDHDVDFLEIRHWISGLSKKGIRKIIRLTPPENYDGDLKRKLDRLSYFFNAVPKKSRKRSSLTWAYDRKIEQNVFVYNKHYMNMIIQWTIPAILSILCLIVLWIFIIYETT